MATTKPRGYKSKSDEKPRQTGSPGQRHRGRSPNADQPFLFFRVGRLKYYDQRRDRSGPIGGGSYNEEEDGSEVGNFQPWRGALYGYAQVPGGGGFNLARVRAAITHAEHVTGALVIMVSGVEHSQGQVVVGWYGDATVYSNVHERPGGRYGLYNFECRTKLAVLLPLSERTQPVKAGKGGMGQSNVFYGLDEQGHVRASAWIRGVLNYIRTYRGPNLLVSEPELTAPWHDPTTHAKGQGWRRSAAEKIAIEQLAMDRAIQYYRDRGYVVTDVRNTPGALDLLCEIEGEAALRIEVKGTTGAGESVIVTVGEVATARREPAALFVLYGISLGRKDGRPVASGGEVQVIEPWRPQNSELRTTQYEYKMPRGSF